jgi:hypothetical protein
MAEAVRQILKERKVVSQFFLVDKLFLSGEDLEDVKSRIAFRKRVLHPYYYLEDFLYFDSEDPLLTIHEKAPEIYYELKYELGYSDKVIPRLMKSIIARYEKLLPVIKEEKDPFYERSALATAIYLTCRGQHVCPVRVSQYPRLVRTEGGFTKVNEWAWKIGERVRFSSVEMLENALDKLVKDGV